MPIEPGDGGVGHSWFAVELTSEHVEPPVVEQPWITAPPGPVRPRIKRDRKTDRFPAKFKVIRSEPATDRFRATIEVVSGDRFDATYSVVESATVAFAATYKPTMRRYRRREEEAVLALLMAEEEWE